MLGDEFTKECRSLEKYIQLLLVHPVISRDVNLRKFLIDEEVTSYNQSIIILTIYLIAWSTLIYFVLAST